jgi:Photosynthesis system II assembly factor YCF48/Secretion system C-terminal sorting domain
MLKNASIICTLLFGLVYCGWAPQNSGTTANLNDVFFYNDSLTGYICGDSGIILKTTNGGNEWIRQRTPVTTKLNAIYFIGDTGWTVGDNGTILMTFNGGGNWYGDSALGNLNFYDVWYFNRNEGLIIGGAGSIYKTSDGGRTWFLIGFCNDTLRNIFFFDNTLGWCVGNNGVVLSTNNAGMQWSLAHAGINTLRGVYFTDPITGYVTGDRGSIFRTINGFDWIQVNSGTLLNLYGIDFDYRDNGFICGDSGFVFCFNGTWTIVDSLVALLSINFPVPRVGWTVGSNGSIYKTSDGMAVVEKFNKRDFGSILFSSNPFTDYLIVKIPANEKMIRLKIYNSLGKVIIDNEAKDGLLRINFKSFTKGVYFIKANNTITKIIKI